MDKLKRIKDIIIEDIDISKLKKVKDSINKDTFTDMLFLGEQVFNKTKKKIKDSL